MKKLNFEERAYETLKKCTHYCLATKGFFIKRRIIFAFRKEIGTTHCLTIEYSKKNRKVINGSQYIADDGFSMMLKSQTTVNVANNICSDLENYIRENLRLWTPGIGD